MIKLSVSDLHIQYGSHVITESITETFTGGNMVAVLGRNGVGKTTLIKAFAGLVPYTGKVRLEENGEKISRKNISYVPQLGAINTRLTVFEMILLGLVNQLHWHVSKEHTDLVEAMVKELKLEAIVNQPFNTLSGGQRQLVSMAQSLISRPKVLLLDEPTSALDLRHQLIVMDLAKNYTEKTGAVTVFVVHDLMLASRYGNQLMLLHEGKVKAFDTADKVLKPELLEDVYNVEISVEETKNGFLQAIPIRPL